MLILPSGASLPDNPRIGYDTVVAAGSLEADESAAAFPVSNLENGATYPPWRGTSTAAQVIRLELGQARSVDYLGLARHNFGTAGITYTLERADDPGGPWTAVASHSPADDTPIVHQFAEATAQVYRLSLSSGSAVPELAVWYLGQILVLERRIYVGHTPIPLAPQRRVSTGRSESGQFLGRIRRSVLYETDISVSNIDPDWYRDHLDPFVQAADITPWFWVWRGQSFPAETAYVWATDEPQPANARGNGMMQWRVSVQGVI